MAAYNEFEGLPCVANRYLLTDLLRGEWGFEGVVMADGTAVDRLVRMTGDPVAAGALALDAGCDLSLWDVGFTRLDEASERGLVSEEALDAAVARVLTLKFRLGLFETPVPPPVPAAGRLPDPAELGERLAAASVTLLSHEGGVLPLSRTPGAARRIAVLGPNADSLERQIGDYTAPQRPGTGITVLDGIRAAAPPGTEVVHARGCALVGDDLSGLPAALAAAASCDVAVLVLGGSSARSGDTAFEANGAAVTGTGTPTGMTCGEGVDLADLALPAGQRALWEAVSASGTPVVVVLVQGRPHALPEVPAASASAVLSAWYPGPRADVPWRTSCSASPSPAGASRSPCRAPPPSCPCSTTARTTATGATSTRAPCPVMPSATVCRTRASSTARRACRPPRSTPPHPG